jgi:ribonuclease T2
MRRVRRLAGLVAAVVLGACEAPAGPGATAQGNTPATPIETAASGFDYYVLALSWSPTYCAEPDNAARDPQQCKARRPFAFVTHGLWPQFERGYPQDCPTEQRDVPAAVTTDMMDIMPSAGLIRHQWRKHGACSGLDPRAFFKAVRAAAQRITIPDAYRAVAAPLRVTGTDVEAAFIAANPGLRADGVAVICRGGRLREVRVCLTPAGALRACGADVADACARTVTMPPVR